MIYAIRKMCLDTTIKIPARDHNWFYLTKVCFLSKASAVFYYLPTVFVFYSTVINTIEQSNRPHEKQSDISIRKLLRLLFHNSSNTIFSAALNFLILDQCRHLIKGLLIAYLILTKFSCFHFFFFSCVIIPRFSVSNSKA